MYRYFRVQNFRSLRDLELQDLAQITLIGGKNNVGKTSLLEALFVMLNPYNPELLFRVNAIRGMSRVRIDNNNPTAMPLDSLFYSFDPSSEIIFEATADDGTEFRFTISAQIYSEEMQSVSLSTDDVSQEASSAIDANLIVPVKITDIHGKETIAPVFSDGEQIRFKNLNVRQRHPLFFFPAFARENAQVIAERYSNLVIEGKDGLILNALQQIEPRIRSLQMLYQAGEPILTADVGMDKKLPVNYMGDGLNRVLQLALAIGNANGGVVLIDEIENGLHYSILPNIWNGIASVAAQFNVQVIATTHSMEMIRAAHEAFSANDPVDFCYYRLDPDPETGTPIAVRYTPNTMAAVVDLGYEVRG